MAPFQIDRASSYPASPGRTTGPVIAPRNPSTSYRALLVMDSSSHRCGEERTISGPDTTHGTPAHQV
jgi:hypothetical protein